LEASVGDHERSAELEVLEEIADGLRGSIWYRTERPFEGNISCLSRPKNEAQDVGKGDSEARFTKFTSLPVELQSMIYSMTVEPVTILVDLTTGPPWTVACPLLKVCGHSRALMIAQYGVFSKETIPFSPINDALGIWTNSKQRREVSAYISSWGHQRKQPAWQQRLLEARDFQSS